MSAPIEEPSIPVRVQRPLAAIWVSIGLHVALIALIQVAPPGAGRVNGPVIEARLMSTPAPQPKAVPEEPQADPASVLAASDLPDTVPVSPVPAPPEPAPPEPALSELIPPEPTPTESAPAEHAVASPQAPVVINSGVDLTFYGARDVDVHPQAMNRIIQAYPPEAEKLRLSGKVVLQLKLEADGRVLEVEVLRASPPDVFDEAAILPFRTARFAPALKDGRPVRALMLIEVTFDWQGRGQ